MSAERHLRAEITRRHQNGVTHSGGCLLQLSLAESLFAQGRLEDAHELCSDIESHPKLLKLERLRLHIVLAKLYHVKSECESALSHWSGAMMTMSKFQRTNGRATRILVLSICDVLSHLGQNWLIRESEEQLASLDQLARPGGIHYWIAGLRHWIDYLQSQNSLRSRM